MNLVTPLIAPYPSQASNTDPCRPGWHGTSGVHVHSTNTKITDPEIIEKRTPVLVKRYEIRQGSGGVGLFRGGSGIVREIEARIPLKFSVVSTRRVYSPYWMSGGGDDSVGRDFWKRKGAHGRVGKVNIGGMAVVNVRAAESIEINTPGMLSFLFLKGDF